MPSFLFAIIELFSLALTVLRSEVGGSLWAQILGGSDVAPNHCWYQKTRVFLLPYSEYCMMLSSFVWIGYQRLSDGRTELPWLIQRSALHAMRPRFKNCSWVQFLIGRRPIRSYSSGAVPTIALWKSAPMLSGPNVRPGPARLGPACPVPSAGRPAREDSSIRKICVRMEVFSVPKHVKSILYYYNILICIIYYK